MAERDDFLKWAEKKSKEDLENKEERNSSSDAQGGTAADEDKAFASMGKGEIGAEDSPGQDEEQEDTEEEISLSEKDDASSGGSFPLSEKDDDFSGETSVTEDDSEDEMRSAGMFGGSSGFGNESSSSFFTEGMDADDDDDEDNVIDTGGEEEEEKSGSQQVSADMFGFTSREEAEDNMNADSPEEEGGGKKNAKVSFSELRNGKKVPRLKKNLVLGICIIGVVGFLILVQVFAYHHKKEKMEFGGSGQRVEKGNVDLAALSKKNDENARKRAGEERERRNESEYDYGDFPAYDTDKPWQRSAESSQKQNYQQPAVVDPNVENERLQREMQAASASLRKDGGYGANSSVQYAPSGTDADRGYQEGRYTPQSGGSTASERASQYASLIAAANGGKSSGSKDRSYENGAYSPENKDAGNFEYFEDNVIFPGTIIHAVLVSRIDTDYPGPIHARVTENIYDSKTGANLLIPQGTILQGNYSSASIGVAKVQIAWESMVVNFNGTAYQVSLGGMAGVDKRGRSGIAGTLDDHYFEWLKAAGVISMFTMLNSEIAWQKNNNKDVKDNKQLDELIDVNQGLVNQLGDRIMNRAMDIQPTVRVANGKAVSVAVNKAVVLRPFKAFEAEQKYIRRSSWR